VIRSRDVGLPEHLDVSWADHWEDVRAWRILHRLDPGFYVDVGAMDPRVDSVTNAWYEHGWFGIDVEPDPTFVRALRSGRPRDRVEAVACGTRPGEATLHVVVGEDGTHTGLTTLESGTAARHARNGARIETIRVPVVPLTELMKRSPAEDPERFHVLKVDVEGSERDVLASADLSAFRPLVVLIEARAPRSTEDTYLPSEEILTANRYVFAADDGLNRWYVRSEDEQLAAVLAPETNPILDGKPRRWYEVEREAQLIARMDELDAKARASAEAAEACRVREVELAAELGAIRTSRSWRVTAPLRALEHLRRRTPWTRRRLP
jgi:FkbM family methyltransferase